MEYIIQDSTLQGIADAIRAKAGTSDPIATSTFAEAIAAIEAGGGGGASIVGMDIVQSGEILFAEPITTSYTITVEAHCSVYDMESSLFVLFRKNGDKERGVCVTGVLNFNPVYPTRVANFAMYIGGTGTATSNNSYLSIAFDITDPLELAKMNYAITCSSNAPLTAHTYGWIFLGKRVG